VLVLTALELGDDMIDRDETDRQRQRLNSYLRSMLEVDVDVDDRPESSERVIPHFYGDFPALITE
jgi:hypothetical protein